MHGLSTETWVNATIGGNCHKYKFLSRQWFCFVVTSIFLSRQKMYLLQPTRVCRDRHAFVTTNTCLSQQKWYLWQLPPMIQCRAINRHGSVHGLTTDIGQCMGYQQTWVNAWADNRHGSMRGLTTDMGQCMGWQQTWVHAWAINRHRLINGLSTETGVHVQAVNRDGQCMGYQQRQGQCMGFWKKGQCMGF